MAYRGAGRYRAAAIHGRDDGRAQGRHAEPCQPDGGDLHPQCLGRSAGAVAARRGPHGLRAAAVSYLRADIVPDAAAASGPRDLAAPALRRGDGARRHRHEAGDIFSGRADDVDRHRASSRARDTRLLLAGDDQLGRCALPDRDRGAHSPAHGPAAGRRLGHDRDEPGRLQRSAQPARQARHHRRAAAGDRDGCRGAG
jgi:hypothetical protein